MKLTKSEEKRIIKALRAARPYIGSGEEGFVCCALVSAKYSAKYSAQHKILAKDSILARDYIMHLIKPYGNVSEWYRRTQYLVQPPTSWRDYRLAWIDHMIEELSK